MPAYSRRYEMSDLRLLWSASTCMHMHIDVVQPRTPRCSPTNWASWLWRQTVFHSFIRQKYSHECFLQLYLDCDVRYFIRHKYMFSTANCTVSRMMLVRSEAANVRCLHSARLCSKMLSDFLLFIYMYMYMPCASCTVILVSASLMFIADVPILTTRQMLLLCSNRCS